LFARASPLGTPHLVSFHVLVVNEYGLRVTDPVSWYLTGFDDPGNLALSDTENLGGLS
jgi:hypothetical protein